MATKKTSVPKEEEIVNAEEEKILRSAQDDTGAEEPVEVSEWDEYEDVMIPRKPKGDDNQYYVCVNDRRFYIPANGRVQKLPKPIAEVLRQSLEAEAEAEEYADSIPNKTGPANEI